MSNETRFSNDVSMKGTLKFKDTLKINGNFKGKIISDGAMTLNKTANINAQIQVKNAVIEGNLSGDINATNMVELRPDAKIFGNIKSKKVKIEEGAVFVGKCEVENVS